MIVKIYNKLKLDRQNYTEIVTEKCMLLNLDNENILKVYEIFENEQEIYVVQERFQGTPLFDYIVSQDNFSESKVAKILQ